MTAFIALVVIFFIYIIPLNIFLYKWSEIIARVIIDKLQIYIPNNEAIQGIALIISKNIEEILISFIYIIFIIFIFIIVRFILYLYQRYFYLDQEKNIYEIIDNYIEKYSVGMKSLNLVLRSIVVILLSILIKFNVYDIRLYVFAVLILLFVLKSYRKRPKKKKEKRKKIVDKRYTDVKSDVKEDSSYVYDKLIWNYNIDSLGIEEPIKFEAKIIIGYENKENEKLSKEDGRRAIKELAEQIKTICESKELLKKHMILVVFSLVKTFNLLEEDEKIKEPIEVIKAKEGTEKEVIKIVASILTYMGFDIKELERPLKSGNKKSYLAISGADEEEGDNYYKENNKKYYHAELENNEFYVGEIKFM